MKNLLLVEAEEVAFIERNFKNKLMQKSGKLPKF
jgi:hypothetical protein